MGATLDPSNSTPVDSGAMISDARFGEFDTLIAAAVKDGARLVCGGKRWTGGKDGAYFEPTMLVDVTQDMRVAREEGQYSFSVRLRGLLDTLKGSSGELT